jgi:hypothetical protein
MSGLLAGAVLVAFATRASAQTLADVAKKEEERRKQTPAGKVYTNNDVGPATPAPPPAEARGDKAADAKPSDASAADDKGDAKPSEGKAGAAADKPAAAVKDQKYWRERITAARLAVERDTGYAEAMQTRINALTTDFVNRDDPAQRAVIERDRNRALAELDRLKKQIVDDKKAVADIEEEARRAGVPPGWLR